MKLNQLTATELSKMLRNKECSAVEISNDVFDAIDTFDPLIHCYITITKEKALEKAKEVDSKIAKGQKLSPLAGIPIAVKDNICVKDTLTTCGSKMLANFVSPYDATLIEKLKACDVVFTGKANLDEFAMGSSCEYSYFGPTYNPHNIEYVAGGSSGGPAAAVAAHETILALASDTGGSIRVPASFCGVVGLKPTYGSVSRYGVIALASSLDQVGPIGKNVDDTLMLYRAICGKDPRDLTTSDIDHKITEDINGDIKGTIIGVAEEYFGEGIDDEVRESVQNFIRVLEEHGAIVKKVHLPKGDEALASYCIITPAEASSNLARYDGVKYGYRTPNYSSLTEMYENTRSEGFGTEVKRRIMLGTFVLSSGYYDSYYRKGKMFQRKVIDKMREVFNECDVVVTPTCASTAFKVGNLVNDPIKMYMSDVCTVFVNIAGLPAISVPCGKDKLQLPIGAQIVGPYFSENKLCRIAKFYEKISGSSR
jgi:aspartyl-tRNA(Asn)/glutamyl-tRNA(Gln) amidotransferase subunit A